MIHVVGKDVYDQKCKANFSRFELLWLCLVRRHNWRAQEKITYKKVEGGDNKMTLHMITQD